MVAARPRLHAPEHAGRCDNVRALSWDNPMKAFSAYLSYGTGFEGFTEGSHPCIRREKAVDCEHDPLEYFGYADLDQSILISTDECQLSVIYNNRAYFEYSIPNKARSCPAGGEQAGSRKNHSSSNGGQSQQRHGVGTKEGLGGTSGGGGAGSGGDGDDPNREWKKSVPEDASEDDTEDENDAGDEGTSVERHTDQPFNLIDQEDDQEAGDSAIDHTAVANPGSPAHPESYPSTAPVCEPMSLELLLCVPPQNNPNALSPPKMQSTGPGHVGVPVNPGSIDCIIDSAGEGKGVLSEENQIGDSYVHRHTHAYMDVAEILKATDDQKVYESHIGSSDSSTTGLNRALSVSSDEDDGPNDGTGYIFPEERSEMTGIWSWDISTSTSATQNGSMMKIPALDHSLPKPPGHLDAGPSGNSMPNTQALIKDQNGRWDPGKNQPSYTGFLDPATPVFRSPDKYSQSGQTFDTELDTEVREMFS